MFLLRRITSLEELLRFGITSLWKRLEYFIFFVANTIYRDVALILELPCKKKINKNILCN